MLFRHILQTQKSWEVARFWVSKFRHSSRSLSKLEVLLLKWFKWFDFNVNRLLILRNILSWLLHIRDLLYKRFDWLYVYEVKKFNRNETETTIKKVQYFSITNMY